MNYSFAPKYQLILRQHGKEWLLPTLQSAHCSLVTGAGVGEASFVLADPTGHLRRTVKPQPREVIEYWTSNRYGQTGRRWTGVVDSRAKAFSPDDGDHLTITATSPVKYFEETRQSPRDVQGLALAYATNITGSQVLQIAAGACGFPRGMLRIHPLADSGSGLQSINGAIFTSPDLQSWSSIVSSIQANSGIEWFFDEYGRCYWRQVGFVDPWFPDGRTGEAGVRRLSLDDILGGDFTQSDKDVVTRVEVRFYGNNLTGPTSGHWTAPSTMEGALGVRQFVVYEPYVLSQNQAAYLASVLGVQYAAGVATASVLIPSDPLIAIGSLVDVPEPGTGQLTRYYVSSVTVLDEWGGTFATALGLSYGRSPDQSFPYLGNAPYAILGAYDNPVKPGPLTGFDGSFDLTGHPIVVNPLLNSGTAATTLYASGTVIQVYTGSKSGGAPIGASPTGDYIVGNVAQALRIPAFAAQAPPVGTISLSSNAIGGGKTAATGYVTVIGQAASAAATTVDAQGAGQGTQGTGVPTRGQVSQAYATANPPLVPNTLGIYWARHAGIPEDQIITCVSIAHAESSMLLANQNHNVGPPPSDDYGLWQINSTHGYNVTQLLTSGQYNANAMQAIYLARSTSSGHSDWSDWTTFTNGKYLQFTAQVGAAVATYPAGSPPPATATTATAPTGGPTSKATAGPSHAPSLVAPANLAQKALATAVANFQGKQYALDEAGPSAWDCSGIVADAYAYNGYGDLIRLTPANGYGYNTDLGPNGIWHYFNNAHGGVACNVADVKAGDLLFIVEPRLVGAFPDQQEGFSHIAFAYSNTQNFGANDTTIGICLTDTPGFRGEWHTPFNRAIDMSNAKPSG